MQDQDASRIGQHPEQVSDAGRRFSINEVAENRFDDFGIHVANLTNVGFGGCSWLILTMIVE